MFCLNQKNSFNYIENSVLDYILLGFGGFSSLLDN